MGWEGLGRMGEGLKTPVSNVDERKRIDVPIGINDV